MFLSRVRRKRFGLIGIAYIDADVSHVGGVGFGYR